MRIITLLFCLLVPALALAAPLESGQEHEQEDLIGKSPQQKEALPWRTWEKIMNAEAENLPRTEAYVFITPVYAAEHLAEGENPDDYEGVVFPVYCGYVAFDENGKVSFTPKTSLPIKRVTEFFESLHTQKCFPVPPQSDPLLWAFSNDSDAICKNNGFYPVIVYEKARAFGMRSAPAADMKADPNFAPEFTETYVYHRNAPKSEWENRFTDPINRYVKYTGEYPFWLTPMH